eukprot:gene20803-22845_t
MFCPKCGKDVKHQSNFYGNCGNAVAKTTSTEEEFVESGLPKPKGPSKSLSYTEYKKKLEQQRASFYRPVSKSKKAKFEQEELVTVNIGIKEMTENGQLKPVRGKALPVKAKKSATADSLLHTAIKKQQAHNDIRSGPFRLLYPNNIEVKTLLEKDDQFILEKYKLEVGRPYNRINLVHVIDYMKLQCLDDCSSEDECSLAGSKKDTDLAKGVPTVREENASFLQQDAFSDIPLGPQFCSPNISAITGLQGQADNVT